MAENEFWSVPMEDPLEKFVKYLGQDTVDRALKNLGNRRAMAFLSQLYEERKPLYPMKGGSTGQSMEMGKPLSPRVRSELGTGRSYGAGGGRAASNYLLGALGFLSPMLQAWQYRNDPQGMLLQQVPGAQYIPPAGSLERQIMTGEVT